MEKFLRLNQSPPTLEQSLTAANELKSDYQQIKGLQVHHLKILKD